MTAAHQKCSPGCCAGGVAGQQQPAAIARSDQPEVLGVDDLCDGEAVVALDQVQLRTRIGDAACAYAAPAA
jgi:hypothetical protein